MTAPTSWVVGLRIEPCASTGALWLARCACRGVVQDVLLHALQGGLASMIAFLESPWEEIAMSRRGAGDGWTWTGARRH